MRGQETMDMPCPNRESFRAALAALANDHPFKTHVRGKIADIGVDGTINPETDLGIVPEDREDLTDFLTSIGVLEPTAAEDTATTHRVVRLMDGGYPQSILN